jgi:hypothetical protein
MTQDWHHVYIVHLFMLRCNILCENILPNPSEPLLNTFSKKTYLKEIKMEYIFAALLISAIGYLVYKGRKQLDVNQDGKVDQADAVAAVAKVETAVVETVKAEVVKVEAKVATKAKTAVAKTAIKAKGTVAPKPAAKPKTATKAVAAKPTSKIKKSK